MHVAEREREFAQGGMVFEAMKKALQTEVPCFAKFFEFTVDASETLGAFHLCHYFFNLLTD